MAKRKTTGSQSILADYLIARRGRDMVRKSYILVRRYDGYRLSKVFNNSKDASKHADTLLTITGREYIVIRYIGTVALQELKPGYM